MRKRSGRLGGKGAPGSARAAILNYLAALDPPELAPLVQLFLQPVSAAFRHQEPDGQPEGGADVLTGDRYGHVPNLRSPTNLYPEAYLVSKRCSVCDTSSAVLQEQTAVVAGTPNPSSQPWAEYVGCARLQLQPTYAVGDALVSLCIAAVL